MIHKTWTTTQSTSVAARIDATRKALSAWHKAHHTNSQEQIDILQRDLERALESPLNDTDLILELTTKLTQAYEAENSYWKQNSRLTWLQSGDRNTGYFHAVTRGRRMRNRFSVIEDKDNTPVFKEEDIAKVIEGFFHEIFTSTPGDRTTTVNTALHPRVTETMNKSLIEDPTSDEIRKAALALHSDKA